MDMYRRNNECTEHITAKNHMTVGHMDDQGGTMLRKLVVKGMQMTQKSITFYSECITTELIKEDPKHRK
jgi:hypothetical protein